MWGYPWGAGHSWCCSASPAVASAGAMHAGPESILHEALGLSRADTEPGVLWQHGAAGNGFHLSAPSTHHTRKLLQGCNDPTSTLFHVHFLQHEECMINASPCTHGYNPAVSQQQAPSQSTGVTLGCFYFFCFIMLLRLSSDTVLINSIPS